jgi:hypothetical protein
MRFFLVVATVALAASVARARLGETRKECNARYGEPAKIDEPIWLPTGESRAYSTRGFMVVAEFMSTNAMSTAAVIYIQKTQHDEAGIPEELDHKQIETLLQANSQSRSWKLVGEVPVKRWERTDGGYAEYRESGRLSMMHALIICTPEGWTAVKDKYNSDRKKEIEGF